MVKFRIGTSPRAIAPILLAACIFPVACREAAARATRDFPGRNAAAVLTDSGPHVVYVDLETRRLMHRGGDETDAVAVSPAEAPVDLRGENVPLLTARSDGSLLVVYPVKLGEKQMGTHKHTFGELRAQLSRDGGKTWSAPRRIDGDAELRGHNFADLATRANGDVVVSWLDSRAGKQGVHAAVLRPDLSVSPAQTVDPKTCQCCRTALFASSNGEVWLAYRDLAEDNVRNMAYAVSGPHQAFEPRGDVVNDHWRVNGCPESGPRFAETSDGTVWLAWFNGGASAIETASATSNAPFTSHGAAVSGPVNHPDLGTLPDGRLVLVYEAIRDGKRTIEARVGRASARPVEEGSSDGAQWTEAKVLAHDGASPHYLRAGDRALLTYTSNADGTPRVHVMDPLPLIEGEYR